MASEPGPPTAWEGVRRMDTIKVVKHTIKVVKRTLKVVKHTLDEPLRIAWNLIKGGIHLALVGPICWGGT